MKNGYKVIEIIDNQLNENGHECTKETYERLIELGYSDVQAKQKMGQVMVQEMKVMLKNEEAFNEDRYCEKLKDLT
ncbi:hypothetical protein E3U55_06440 [Filobacillus milosensis]|uniref:Uncharacterized protein n=1 Tax=Filobacillus milosensis TaxID=94137 RepID=A0A4Y8IQA0_9BACI|nr:hypothetical protein [Filobacillus milosensis]TFB22873.1 hypothetical protein E3U55_06440 [Filobacillus milosensis]